MTPVRVVALIAGAIALVANPGPAIADAATASVRAPATRLLIARGDNFMGGSSVVQTKLQTDLAPMTATAHAVLPGGSVRAMRVAVVLMRLPGSALEPVSKASVQSSTFGATGSVADWFSQTSGGQVAVSGTVFGYFDGVSSCDLAAQTQAAETAAAPAGYIATDYDHLVVYTPNQPCDFSGIGWVGSNGVFLNGTVDRGIMEHEIGHNLGLWHAGLYECADGASSPSCLVDYGDPADVMGGTDPDRGYSAEHKHMLGWIPESEVQTLTSGTHDIALTASENPLVAGSTQLIHVRSPDGTLYAVDRRSSVGYDSGLSGVWIRQVAYVNTDDTQLVRGSALAAGQTFTDPASAVTIKTLTDSGPTATVRVCVGPCDVPAGSQTILGAVAARNVATGSRASVSNGSLTLTVPSGHGVATGHTVIVATYAGGGVGAVSCRDDRGNAYAVNLNSLGAQRLIVCSTRVTTALTAGAKITIRYPAFNGSTVASANDFSGINPRTPIDQRHAGAGSIGSVDSGTTAMTVSADEVVFGVEIHRGVASFTPASGYTRVGARTFTGPSTLTITPGFKVVTAVGTYKYGGSLSAARQWRAGVLTFFRA
jgi:hypothetical protein